MVVATKRLVYKKMNCQQKYSLKCGKFKRYSSFKLNRASRTVSLHNTDWEMSTADREEMALAAAKKKASEIVHRAATNRSGGKLMDIGKYQTGLHYEAISKFLANFHERPSLLIPKIQRNLRALLKIEMQRAVLECEFQKNLLLLKMESLYPAKEALMEKRREIIEGGSIPRGNEDWTGMKNHHHYVDAGMLVDYLRGIKGIPYFWRGVFISTPFLRGLCSDRDWPVLAALQDVQSRPTPMGGFRLEFRFAPNSFMADKVLIKSFEGTYKFDRDRQYKFDGWSVDSVSGLEIRWNPGMDPTITTWTTICDGNVKQIPSVASSNKTKSFFNFFAKPVGTAFTDTLLLNAEKQLEVGKYFFNRVIPSAILLLIGEEKDT